MMEFSSSKKRDPVSLLIFSPDCPAAHATKHIYNAVFIVSTTENYLYLTLANATYLNLSRTASSLT